MRAPAGLEDLPTQDLRSLYTAYSKRIGRSTRGAKLRPHELEDLLEAQRVVREELQRRGLRV